MKNTNQDHIRQTYTSFQYIRLFWEVGIPKHNIRRTITLTLIKVIKFQSSHLSYFSKICYFCKDFEGVVVDHCPLHSFTLFLNCLRLFFTGSSSIIKIGSFSLGFHLDFNPNLNLFVGLVRGLLQYSIAC